MKRTLIFLAFTLTGLVVTFGIAGCLGYLPPTINLRADGVIEHIDTNDMPCVGALACYEKRADGSRHIYKSATTPQWAVEHEDAHDKGMTHGDFHREWNNQLCATVTASGGKYIKGQTICITHRGETVF